MKTVKIIKKKPEVNSNKQKKLAKSQGKNTYEKYEDIVRKTKKKPQENGYKES